MSFTFVTHCRKIKRDSRGITTSEAAEESTGVVLGMTYNYMILQFRFEDGRGKVAGREPIDMEIDKESFPLDSITHYNNKLGHIEQKKVWQFSTFI